MESGRITRTAPSASVSTEAGHGDVAHGQRQVARPRNRPDIDGLRALAVVPVLLFHAHVPYVTGGFVGVDVFFVISGYLITSILHREIVEQQFSLLTFYERRARRILPAVYVLMAAVLVSAWFLFLPKDLRDTGQGILATAVYASNFLFYAKTNYFGATALSQPLLHTWSLGVEEQFYIFFPLLLYVLLMKTGRWAIPLLLAIFGGSLLLSIVTTYDYPAENFYFPVTRAWELGLGSLLAIALQRKILAARSSELLSLLGLVLIAASIFLLHEGSTFPGLTAVPVCLGTALVIYAGTGAKQTAVSKVLARRPIAFIGLISYSLYLWHWPALVFANFYFLRPLGSLALASLLGAIFIVSLLSWRFIEQPVRRGKVLRKRASLFAAAAIGVAGFSAAGLACHFSNGFPARMPASVLALDAARQPESLADCAPAPGAPYGGMCKVGAGVPRFIVWGDSHAGALRPTFDLAAHETHSAGYLISANACAPLIGVEPKPVGRATNDCPEYDRKVLDIIRRENVGTVFLVGDWWTDAQPGYLRGDLATGFANTLEALKGRQVYVVERVPGARSEVAATMARAALFNRKADLEFTTAEVARQDRTTAQALAAVAAKYPFSTIDPKRVLCSRSTCAIERAGRPLYSDATHLSPWAALYLAPLFEPALPH